ncbi:unnamed protein product [Urochloa decumbens]|uniref:LOB domain-containing protein n=1 Tax=Urochloa decumbens TaxID=240449 RepID=A0ABC9FSX8_9POAL
MSTSSNPHLRLHVDTTTTTSSNTHGSAASPGSGSSSHSSRSPASSGAAAAAGPGGGQNQSQACAACKYQRRKCNPDCPLAPYFPADQQRRFLNAHRLFGVSKIQKTLQRIDPERVPDAMRTLVFQSDARAADPVGGCVAIIENLQKQIARAELELAYVNHQIAIYRQAAAAADSLAGGPAADMMILPAAAGQDNAVSLGALYAAAGGQEPVLTPAGGGLVFHGQNHHPPPQQLYNYFCYGDGTAAGDEATSSDGSVQQQYGFAGDAAASVVKMNGSPAALGEQLEQQCRVEAAAASFVDAFDVKPRAAMPPPAAVGRHGPAAGVLHRREEKLSAGLKKHGDGDDIDQHMEEAAEITAAAAPPCQLELGFSSSF